MAVLEAGQTFERYRILRELGSGVSGESYEAEDTMLLRKVTLKLIHPWRPLFDLARRQFFREMQSISILHHPYLASVLDYGEINGQLYVARRYVSSGSLLGSDGRFWFRPPLSIFDAVQYIHQLAQALDYIHKHGCLHGAVTFSNILVLRGPNLDHEADYAPFLLADVGLTNFVRRFGESQTSLLPITAAPEQLGKRVIPASDQFALAVLLYFWLAGRPPYLGTQEEIEDQKLTGAIPTLRSLNSRVTVELEAVIFRALSVYPEERYVSVLAFAEALWAALPSQREPIALPELTPQEQFDTLSKSGLQEDIEPVTEPELSLQSESTLVIETDTLPQLEPEAPSEQLSLSQGDQPQPVPDVPQPLPDPNTPQTLPEPNIPETEPEPEVPETQPGPIPGPEPDVPETQPEPEVPETQPDIIPQTIPDVPQPLPEPGAPQPEPQILPQAEVSTEETATHEEFPSVLEDAQASIPARVLITSPYAEEPYEVVLEQDEITLGRAGSSDILLDKDNLTSRHHALLRREDNQYVIYDRKSANGVFVNGQRLVGDARHVLVDGDHISIGNYELIFRSQTPRGADRTDNEGSASATTLAC